MKQLQFAHNSHVFCVFKHKNWASDTEGCYALNKMILHASFAEEKNRNVYSRFSNPNNAELFGKLWQLEGAEAGHTFATGMGAIFSSFAALLNSGDHVLSARAVFGSTHTLFTKIFPKWNIETTYFDSASLSCRPSRATY